MSSKRAKRATQLQQADVGEIEVKEQINTDSETYIKIGSITGHVRNGNRLNVALTRAMHGIVVVCQKSLLTNNRGTAGNAISNMCANATDRKCYVEDD